MKTFRKMLSVLVTVAMVFTMLTPLAGLLTSAASAVTLNSTASQKAAMKELAKYYTDYIVVKNRPLGASHYAYTDASSDETGAAESSPSGRENSYHPGSEMVRLEILANGDRRETTLLKSAADGLIRDPDVSADGTTVLFSYKKSTTDDFHLYTMDLTAANPADTLKQLTFGSGIADTEPKYLANGKIIFSSTRCIQTVDCWYTPVCNLFICDADGQNIIRVGYDQVHTTYPTVTSDGRVIYTRWDYNDRNQVFIQGVFQMQQDGTNQTELVANGMCWPTTLLHTREIPNTADQYVSIVSGHHTWQAGKMVVIDLSNGRNDKDSINYVFPKDNTTQQDINKQDHVDAQAQEGPLYRYPVALSDHEFLVSYAPNGWYGSGDDRQYTKFEIYYMNSQTGVKEVVSEAITGANYTDTIAASQIVPIATRDLFNRPSMVNYNSATGTVYVADVYKGEGMEGVDPALGEAKYLRVVELEFRSYAVGANIARGTGSADPFSPVSAGNGSWDVKKVLGIVPIEPDGSALFKVPADKPIYFQVLDEEGEVIQTMRSWATLMPGETFSCVGCHEDKNTAPPASSGVTLAMKNGVQELQKDLWMTGEEYEDYDPYEDATGFSYAEQIQPILDNSCVECHTNSETAYEQINVIPEKPKTSDVELIGVKSSGWQYASTTPASTSWYQPSNFTNTNGWTVNQKGGFGSNVTGNFGSPKTEWSTNVIYLRHTFEISEALYTAIQSGNVPQVYLNLACDESATVYLNGRELRQVSNTGNDYQKLDITDDFLAQMRQGTNYLAITSKQSSGGQYLDAGIAYPDVSDGSYMIVENESTGWEFRDSAPSNSNWYTEAGFSNVSGWQQNVSGGFGLSGAGNLPDPYTRWNTSELYIRRTFEVPSAMYEAIQSGDISKISLFIGYDESPTIYLNGELLVSYNGFNTTIQEKVITAAFKKHLKEGTNYIALKASQSGGGQYVGFSIGYTVVPFKDVKETTDPTEPEEVTILETQTSGWQFRTTTISGDTWYLPESFSNTTGWQLNKTGGFGTASTQFGTPGTDWTSTRIYLRRTFEISEEMYELLQTSVVADKIFLNIAYDESPTVYFNGVEIASFSGHNNSYEPVDVTALFRKYMRVGTNYLAIKGTQTAGGQWMDAGFSYLTRVFDTSDTPVSLQSTAVPGYREQFDYMLSYLVLTGSKQQAAGEGGQFLATPVNDYTNWVSGMSQCEVLDVRQHGSSLSFLIDLLESGHMGVELTDAELYTLRTWIDLGVPFRGAYDEAVDWNANQMREKERKENKRAYYDTLDAAAKSNLAGNLTQNASTELTVSYYRLVSGKETLVKTVTGYNLVELVPDSPAALQGGSKIVVELPKGQHYLALSVTSNVAESIVYVPSGTFTYVLPSNAVYTFPKNSMLFAYPMIMARIPTAEELESEHLLSVNLYDSYSNQTVYPHASASNNYGSQPQGNAEFQARNAIDGFNNNLSHGTWPVQSWGPEQNQSNLWYEIDFGHDVQMDRLKLYLRADFPHDQPFEKVTVQFADGTSVELGAMQETALGQEYLLPETKTSSRIRLLLQAPANAWCALSEVQVYGSEVPGAVPSPTPDGLLGDVDSDGSVTSTDARLTLQYYAGKITENDLDLSVADVDKDGAYTSTDARLILQYYAGKIKEWP